jgi:hypothetical protein
VSNGQQATTKRTEPRSIGLAARTGPTVAGAGCEWRIGRLKIPRLHHPNPREGDAIVPRHAESKAAKILKSAGFKSKQVPGIHQVIVSEAFRGRQRWSNRMDAAVLELTGDPNLVAVIRSAAIVARRDYLIDEMAVLAEVSR